MFKTASLHEAKMSLAGIAFCKARASLKGDAVRGGKKEDERRRGGQRLCQSNSILAEKKDPPPSLPLLAFPRKEPLWVGGGTQKDLSVCPSVHCTMLLWYSVQCSSQSQ